MYTGGTLALAHAIRLCLPAGATSTAINSLHSAMMETLSGKPSEHSAQLGAYSTSLAVKHAINAYVGLKPFLLLN